MDNLDITYLDFRNSTQKNQVKKSVDIIRQFFPYWVKKVVVTDCGDYPSNDENSKNTGTVLTVKTLPEYRTIHIDIYTGFYSCAAAEQPRNLLHELFHTYQVPTHDFVMEELLPLLEEKGKEVIEILTKEYMKHLEGVTQDLTLLFWNSFVEKKNVVQEAAVKKPRSRSK